MSKSVMLPEELEKLNAVLCARSELEYIAGMLESVCWMDMEHNELLNDILRRVCKLLGRDE